MAATYRNAKHIKNIVVSGGRTLELSYAETTSAFWRPIFIEETTKNYTDSVEKWAQKPENLAPEAKKLVMKCDSHTSRSDSLSHFTIWQLNGANQTLLTSHVPTLQWKPGNQDNEKGDQTESPSIFDLIPKPVFKIHDGDDIKDDGSNNGKPANSSEESKPIESETVDLNSLEGQDNAIKHKQN